MRGDRRMVPCHHYRVFGTQHGNTAVRLHDGARIYAGVTAGTAVTGRAHGGYGRLHGKGGGREGRGGHVRWSVRAAAFPLLLPPPPSPPPFRPLLHDSLLMNVRRWCELIRSVAHDCRRRGFTSRVAGAFCFFEARDPSDAPAPFVLAAAPPSPAFLFPIAFEPLAGGAGRSAPAFPPLPGVSTSCPPPAARSGLSGPVRVGPWLRARFPPQPTSASPPPVSCCIPRLYPARILACSSPPSLALELNNSGWTLARIAGGFKIGV